MELNFVSRLVLKGTLVHETLARAPKYIKKHQTKKTKKKGQHKARENHKRENKTKHGREDERREMTLKAIKGFAFKDKVGFQILILV
jgi:hypothetical protein